MANEQNLKPITNSQMARELQEKSVEKRKENQEKEKTFKAMLLLALEKINEETGKTKREEIKTLLDDLERKKPQIKKQILNAIINPERYNLFDKILLLLSTVNIVPNSNRKKTKYRNLR